MQITVVMFLVRVAILFGIGKIHSAGSKQQRLDFLPVMFVLFGIQPRGVLFGVGVFGHFGRRHSSSDAGIFVEIVRCKETLQTSERSL
jgi:hypothetical protein